MTNREAAVMNPSAKDDIAQGRSSGEKSNATEGEKIHVRTFRPGLPAGQDLSRADRTAWRQGWEWGWNSISTGQQQAPSSSTWALTP